MSAQICKNKGNEEVKATFDLSFLKKKKTSFVMSSHFSPNSLHNSMPVTNADLMCLDNLSTITFFTFSADRNVSFMLWRIEA